MTPDLKPCPFCSNRATTAFSYCELPNGEAMTVEILCNAPSCSVKPGAKTVVTLKNFSNRDPTTENFHIRLMSAFDQLAAKWNDRK